MLNGAVFNGVVFNGSAEVSTAEELTLQAATALSEQTAWNQLMALIAQGGSPVATYYNPQQELTETGEAALQQVAAYIQSVTLDSSAAGVVEAQVAAAQWLYAAAQESVDHALQRYFEGTLDALADLPVVGAAAAQQQDTGAAAGDLRSRLSTPVTEALAAALLQEATLTIVVTDTLDAEAGDSAQALGTYFANVRDMAGSWLVFKVSGEVVQGWVMNLEGERPFSEYSEFDFNSMAQIGGGYFAATDDGLYVLGGDTDEGAQIDARLSSMMLDFGSTAQKRVVAAYLGYTSTGTVMLKVRSVANGKLVEHWYEATDVTADAPREGYRPLGRGLKSRYWQFEIANVDGADFEIDKLELQPIKLRRRV